MAASRVPTRVHLGILISVLPHLHRSQSMTQETTLTLPTVHMNGTGYKTLSEDYEQADDAFRDFIKAFGKIEFNARDYYVQNPRAYAKARDERNAINLKILEIKTYIDAHRIAIHEQAPHN